MAEQDISVEGAQTIAKTLTTQRVVSSKERFPPARDCVTALDMSGDSVAETCGLPFLPAVVTGCRELALQILSSTCRFFASFSCLDADRFATTKGRASQR